MTDNKRFLNTSLASKSVVDRVLDWVTNAIIDGTLKPGDKIPTELEMCELFGVGRNSIREAIKILISYGVVYIKRSEGTFVSDRFSHNMLDPILYGIILQKDSATEIMELRQVFDIGLIQIVVEKASVGSVIKIKQAFQCLSKEITSPETTPEQSLEADIAFHNAIIQCAGNVLISYTAEYIDRITIPSRVRTMHSILEQGHRSEFIDLHRRIVEVIENRTPELIAQTVRDHYQYWKLELDTK